MPRYFFHSEDGETYLDPDGAELADDLAARLEATRYFAELLNEEGVEFWRAGRLRMTVTDAAGATVCILNLTGMEGADPGA
jgi:hypothetical protein